MKKQRQRKTVDTQPLWELLPRDIWLLILDLVCSDKLARPLIYWQRTTRWLRQIGFETRMLALAEGGVADARITMAYASQFTAVEQLYINSAIYDVRAVPYSMLTLPMATVTQLRLDDCKLDRHLLSLPQLTRLIMKNVEVTSDALCWLTRLEELRWHDSYCDFSQLVSKQSLRFLVVASPEPESPLAELARLTQLRKLDIGGCTDLSSPLRALTQLERLSVWRTSLEDGVLSTFTNLVSLRTDDAPEEILQLTALTALDTMLDADLECEVTRLTNLRCLSINSNTRIDATALFQLSRLECLRVEQDDEVRVLHLRTEYIDYNPSNWEHCDDF